MTMTVLTISIQAQSSADGALGQHSGENWIQSIQCTAATLSSSILEQYNST
jgi:hypothetical protein